MGTAMTSPAYQKKLIRRLLRQAKQDRSATQD